MADTADIPQDPVHKRPACIACNKSKRKCNRQLPACQLCRKKRIRCTYALPSVLVSSIAPMQSTASDQPASRGAPPTPSYSSSVQYESASPSYPAAAAPQSTTELRPDADSRWFLSPCSWEIDHVSISDDNHVTYPDSGLTAFLDCMRTWLDDWTTENHCPLIHSRIWGVDLPGPLQYAHAAWLTYRAAKTTPAKKIALNLCTKWAKNLVQEQSIYDTLNGDPIDLLSHLARTQALLIFQVICLFDGHVRARVEAENLSHTLTRWSVELLHKASMESITPYSPGPDEQLNHPQIKYLYSDDTIAADWKAWILSESIRRTWIVATLTEAAFLIMKQDFAICPGSIAFSGRQGLWDAPSPQAWLACSQKASSVKTPVFCRGLVRLLDEGLPTDTDDFVKALLIYGSGKEQVDDWGASV
jgi:hypothetical protein